jgi:hypothetical protein
MPVLGEVIPLFSRRSRYRDNLCFSVDDEAMISSLSGMLADEMAVCDNDGSARARIYFYFSFHQYSVERWMALLFAQETVDGKQLAQQLGNAFQYVTSTVILDGSRVDGDGYRKNLKDLADHLRALLQLIPAS